MKKLLIALILILSVSAHAQTGDQNYEEGYDDATEKQGEWSENEEYLDGYEDAQRQLDEQQRQEEERRDRRSQQDD